MIIGTHVQSYIKTTETCNLNCSHCFTSGSQGKKIFFNPERTADFFKRLARDCPWIQSMRFMFHGGEPFLAPIEDLYKFHELTKNLFKYTSYSIQSNLVFKLTDEKRKFLKDIIFENGFGTSWDYDIRFTNDGQEKLWEQNVQTLAQEDGHYMTMIVSMSKGLLTNNNPMDIIEYARRLGFKHILFERITTDGNAKENSDIIPSNKLQDEWILRMYEQSLEHKLYEKIGNMFLNEMAQAFVNKNHTANRCRDCEQTLLTINADGTIAGCPNTAPRNHWGHIDMRVMDSLNSKRRMETITCETIRDPRCMSCPVNDICNGDCHQLGWEEDICGAPKSLMLKMQEENKVEDYKKFLYD